jgi:hypothetical protein
MLSDPGANPTARRLHIFDAKNRDVGYDNWGGNEV